MNLKTLVAALVADLKQDLLAYRNLRTLLEAQLDAARHHDGPKMQLLLPEIGAVAEGVRLRDAARKKILKAAGANDGVWSLLAGHLAETQRAACDKLRFALQQAVIDCVRLNERCARLMARQQESIKRALAPHLGAVDDCYEPV